MKISFCSFGIQLYHLQKVSLVAYLRDTEAEQWIESVDKNYD